MKNIVSIIALCTMLFGACKKDTRAFVISNDTSQNIIDKVVVLSKNEVLEYLADSNISKWVVVKDQTGEMLVSQCDDLDGDGSWDEIAFLCDLNTGEKKEIQFTVSDSQPHFMARTNIRFGRMIKPFEEVKGDLRMTTNDTKFTAPVYQMEGPAWENDLIAFRNYYDFRNGIDIFGKTTQYMVMDSVGVNGREYHTLNDWGMDILKVGNSLGACAIALGIGDSVYRIGPCEEGRYRMISEGPVRAILELTYKNVSAGDRLYQIIHQISIFAGESGYRSHVWVDGLKGDESLVTGIVNLHNVSADTLSAGDKKIMYSLGNQGYSGEMLGMGILFPESELLAFSEAPQTGKSVVSTHLVALKLKEKVPVEFMFIAVWENRDAGIKELPYFKNILTTTAAKVDL